MLQELTIQGIKSFNQETNIPCSQFTIITGSNSSGKSTILQALLLLKQSYGALNGKPGIHLKGSQANLGKYSDVASAFDKPEIITIKCVVDNTSLFISCDQENESPLLKSFQLISDNQINVDIFKLDRLSNGTGPTKLAQDKGHKHIYSDGSNYYLFSGLKPIFQFKKTDRYTELQKRAIRHKFESQLNEELNEYLSTLHLKGEKERDLFEHAKNSLKSNQIIPALSFLNTLVRNTDNKKGDLFDKLEDLDSQAEISESIFNKVKRILDPMQLSALIQSANFIDELIIEDIIQQILISAESTPYEEYNIDDQSGLKAINNHLKKFFGNIYYLGPLRQEPKLLYEDEVLEEQIGVGRKGELTVPLLFYNQNAIHSFIKPSDIFSTDNSIIQTDTLSNIINIWVRYLRIADRIDIEQIKPYGLSLKVIFGNKENSISSDLPNVGVGVSQILPILVQVSIVPNDGIIILEQPELHLHPAIQSKLCDFLIAQSKLGKQIIIETHSEHMINTMRLHIAKKSISKNKVSLIYCEKDNYGSTKSLIEIDERGMIPRWPVGFFDETEKNITEILKNALRSKNAS